MEESENRLLHEALERKRHHRQALAALPVEEKLAILRRLQVESNEIAQAVGRPLRAVWPDQSWSLVGEEDKRARAVEHKTQP